MTFSDPFGLKVCFAEKGRDQLVKATKEETATEFTLDDDGCAKDVKPRGDDLTARGQAFSAMASADEKYSVRFGEADEVSRYDEASRTAIINRADIGRPYDQMFMGLCQPGGFGDPTWDLGSILSHELLGHGWSHYLGVGFKGPFEESRAIGVENLSHAQHGRPARCM